MKFDTNPKPAFESILIKIQNHETLGLTWLSGVPNFTRRLGELSLTRRGLVK